jgi:hypothetical protein
MKELTKSDAVKNIRDKYQLIIDGATLVTEYAIDIGRMLIEQKKNMAVSEWHTFVQDELPFNMEGAKRFMSIFGRSKELTGLQFGLLEAKMPSDKPEPEVEIPEPKKKKERKPKEPKPKPDTPTEMYDMLGKPVPESIMEIFGRADEIKTMIRQLSLMLTKLKESQDDELYQYLKIEPIQAMIKDVKRSLRFAVPYAICPYCFADEDNQNCKACNGTGWVSEAIYKAVPKELKKKG